MQKYDDEKEEFIKNNKKKQQITKDFQKYSFFLNTNIIKEKITEYEEEENPFDIERKIEMKLKEDIQLNNFLSDASLD